MAARGPPSHSNKHDQAERVEPLFVQVSDICISTGDESPGCLEICLAAEDVSGPVTILGAQPQGRGKTHWRLYPRTNQDRLALIQAGAITLRGQEASLLQKNPFVVRPGATTTRVIVSNVPLSYDNEEISKTLSARGYKMMSRVIDERARNKEGKLTRFLTGRRFMYIEKPSTPLPPKISVGAFVAEFYHREQKEASRSRAQKCSNCLQEGHHRSTCENEVICHQCKKPGHKKGDPACVLEDQEVTITSVPDETLTNHTSNNSNAEAGMEPGQESDTGDEASDVEETNGEPIMDNPEGRTGTRQPKGRAYSTRSRTHSNVNSQKHTGEDKGNNDSENNTPDVHGD
ncbi:Hypp260 [Branchiostoma lanceolatum]|uniref:Hypp260 protein n=1 Tax=Branchiostoma lanceolatum TaxID=7740 RepID=A0A8J9YK51_BRALA|nr:Hypp260 [Branchiostoma lanceolatum]